MHFILFELTAANDLFYLACCNKYFNTKYVSNL